MTPPEERHRYREQIGAFLLGDLDEGERTAMQRHLSDCPACHAEVRELQPVVAALAYAAPDRIDENLWPPEDLEESTLAPIFEEMHRARRRRQRFGWSALAAAAICVVAISLAGFTWLVEPAVAWEQLSSSWEARGVEVEGNLIAHDSGTEIRLVVSGMRDSQSHRVTLVSEDEEQVQAGTFIGTGDEPVRCKLNAALLRKDADRLEVRTPDGELVFSAELPEKPTVELFGIFPWPDPSPQAGPGSQNEIAGPNRPERTDGPNAEGQPPDETQEKPKDGSSGDGAPYKGSSPESDGKSPSPGSVKPGAVPNEYEPGRGSSEQPLYYQPSEEKPPADNQYEPQP
jgi:Putative zinc-finger